ncbi:XrtA-associated tyrosine autokinase [Haliea sp. E1-2-M8]|uniref:XrtA-associated tyrosine autokinase n=1 Tax=Haliea sp. E1-2-M8 TaxID=3064706 RepID=UPI00271D7E78|nr:XrtA-associated tyrosine autokinase [Haliea sp. E1-2-M8]MDO8860432.1 XrtA-associated tyrosine autokinase [Haliea sp. E1-2-M8]
MSTIEKALDRLKDDKRAAQEVADPGNNTVERAAPAGPLATSDEVGGTTATGSSFRVNIPFDALHEQGFLTPATPRSQIAEEFRAIKRPLLKNIAGKGVASVANANLIMVTSALQGDGKTFSSLNLAISIAMEQDKTVLFVDADVLKATAGRLLGIPSNTPGLIDILRDQAVPEDVILPTSMDKLRFLPAGTPDEHSTESLAGENMHQLMLEFSARYPDRVIIFDSPPLLLTTEAGVLASFMGQIVFVAAADITPQQAVLEALEHIGPDKMVGMLLNCMPRRRLGLFGKGVGYGYGYGYGYGSRLPADPEPGQAMSGASGQ